MQPMSAEESRIRALEEQNQALMNQMININVNEQRMFAEKKVKKKRVSPLKQRKFAERLIEEHNIKLQKRENQ